MTYAVSRPRRPRPLGARYTGPIPLGASNPLEVLEDRFTRVVKAQSDRVLDNVGDRLNLYLDSSSGQRLMDKFGTKVEESLTEAAYKHKWELLLAGISVAAMTVVGVSLGGKVGKTGMQVATGVAVAAALPLLLGGGETEEERQRREAADRERSRTRR
jgi:hypothetical protein